jgi:hypothetical protein
MNTTVNNNFLNHVSEECILQVKQCTTIVIPTGHHKIFSTADLWNIQRQAKYRTLRRFI